MACFLLIFDYTSWLVLCYLKANTFPAEGFFLESFRWAFSRSLTTCLQASLNQGTIARINLFFFLNWNVRFWKGFVYSFKENVSKVSHWIIRHDQLVRQPWHPYGAEGHQVSPVKFPVFSRRFTVWLRVVIINRKWLLPQRSLRVCQSYSSVREGPQTDISGTEKEWWVCVSM